MKLLLILFIAALPHWEVHSALPSVVQILSGTPQVFSGEQVALRCLVDDASYLNFQWFRNWKVLFSTQDVTITESGEYSCQGSWKTAKGSIYANTSKPFVIEVVESSAILQHPDRQVLVGDNVSLTCRLRGNPVPTEVVLYRGDVEVRRQSGGSLRLGRVGLSEEGSYHCEARLGDNTVKSPPTRITVLEILTEPNLLVNPYNPGFPPGKMQLVCEVEYHAHPPAPPLVYFFYWNGAIMRPATTESSIFVPTLRGDFHCRAKVPLLNIERLSQVTTK
ncbi:B-cell receptor CD22-like isoform X1 [Osmerus eperlanus]|uniref:B-cell receptor CD22-like isoform X1 n=1 Tax=Osmerus eperlanus TaxID=29151 RepID=UPI002E12A52B